MKINNSLYLVDNNEFYKLEIVVVDEGEVVYGCDEIKDFEIVFDEDGVVMIDDGEGWVCEDYDMYEDCVIYFNRECGRFVIDVSEDIVNKDFIKECREVLGDCGERLESYEYEN